IDSINNPNDTTYIHHFDQAITGCYFIIGVDETLNRSAPSNTVCIPHDTCSVYQLPNVFTPNNDGYNDIFTPFPYTSIEKAEAEILNRWGQVIFRTDDPNLNWDGRDQSTNKECATGVYFYVINLHEITLQGLIQRTISGQVHLLRE
ncbi:MAG: gliding motility-associated C-terminal domain-containing protein, partial [Bacteroidales bacterium]|nr:gliding motility-associated C-terminal domain-containing protein [Bacteroidales bacterium]